MIIMSKNQKTSMNESSLKNQDTFKRYICTSIFPLEEEYRYTNLKTKTAPSTWQGDQYLNTYNDNIHIKDINRLMILNIYI